MQKITPFLWFDKNAEEAMNFYVSIFKNSKVLKVARYGDAGPGPKGSVMAATFQLEGQEFQALNGGPTYKFTASWGQGSEESGTSDESHASDEEDRHQGFAESSRRGMRRTEPRATKQKSERSLDDEVRSAVAWLKRHSSKATRDGMARYAIPSDNALGVSVANIRVLGKQLGRNHELAAALWDTAVYEARMLTSFVDEPARVTAAQMDRWCGDFDNWAIVDTVCFHLFDRTPHAWQKVAQWHARDEEFVKRAAFALLWGLTVHDKQAGDAQFVEALRFVERAAADDRNFVKKAVNMSLRAIGKRNPALNIAAVAVARRLADSPDAPPRWVGKDALRELTGPAVTRRLRARGLSGGARRRA